MRTEPTTMDSSTDDQSLQRGVAERDELLCALVEILRDNETGLQRVLQSMYNLLQDNLLCSSQLVHTVISAVISGSQEEIPTRRRLMASALVCVQMQLRKVPADDGALLLQELLAKTLDHAHPYLAQILEHLFNDFVRVLGADCFPRLLDATRNLLQSEESLDRRSSFFLMSKIQMMCGLDGASGEALLDCLQCTAQQWSAIVAIISDLEEQETHLVVSKLDNHLSQLQLMSSDIGERWLAWLRILCLRLLQVERVLVLRKVLDYFLTHLSVAQLCRFSLLPEFLMATNRSQLFDPEDDNCLKAELLKQFVAAGSVELLLEALVAVSWESVPLLLWIDGLQPEQVNSVSKELFIKLCLAVRALDNCKFRGRAQLHVISLFKDTLNSFSLRDYMSSIESLFNEVDFCSDHDRLMNKINNCTDFEAHIDCFNRRSYNLFVHNLTYFHYHVPPVDLLDTFIPMLQTVPKDRHCFWRLILYYLGGDELSEYYCNIYNVDMAFLQKGAILKEMQEHLLDRLDCQTSEEISFLKARSVDLFTWNLESWSQLEELNMDPLELMDQGSDDTINNLVLLLETLEKRLGDESVLPALIARIRCTSDSTNILRYALNYLTEKEFESCLTDLMFQRKYFVVPVLLSASLNVKVLLGGEPTRGVRRIEDACAYKFLDFPEYNAEVRMETIKNIQKNKNKEIGCKIFKELLRINEELSIKHPFYPENSDVHRQKMRIAIALNILYNYCDDATPLESLLSPNDHLGINLLHEFLVAKCVENIDRTLKALSTLQPRLQESCLSVAYLFILKNWEEINRAKLCEMFVSILPLTKGSSYATRTLAQLILHKLAVKCEENSIQIPLAVSLKNSIEASLGRELHELQSEPRLFLAERCLTLSDRPLMSYHILCMINAPFDEISLYSIVLSAPFDKHKLYNARQAFKAREMLTSAEVAPPHNLYEEVSRVAVQETHPGRLADQELVLVASLLHKEADLAGLRRSCQKFGVKTLVLGNQSQSEEPSSANLSIVKVKPESTVEFLLAKRAEGFKIVGSTGSSGDPKFCPFEFPKKCILVLGHERHGIPADVTGVLDDVVELPQFGSVDANLGAYLLLWEFFKQHCA